MKRQAFALAFISTIASFAPFADAVHMHSYRSTSSSSSSFSSSSSSFSSSSMNGGEPVTKFQSQSEASLDDDSGHHSRNVAMKNLPGLNNQVGVAMISNDNGDIKRDAGYLDFD